jgi:hypothetical protein
MSQILPLIIFKIKKMSGAKPPGTEAEFLESAAVKSALGPLYNEILPEYSKWKGISYGYKFEN